MRRHRCRKIQQVLRNRIKQASLCVADHVGVDTATRGGRGQADAGQHLAEFVHRDPAAGGGVVLVVLHPVCFRQIPFVLHDEGLLARPKQVGKQFSVNMHVLER